MFRTSVLVRGGRLLGLLVVVLALWSVNGVLEGARRSIEWVAHTQQVLAAAETVLGTLVDVEAAVRGYATPGDRRNLGSLDLADRTIPDVLDTLTALTTDNPPQQGRIEDLRADAANALRALHTVADAQGAGGTPGAADLNRLQASMDSVRRTLQPIRLEENRLLALRVGAARAAVSRLRWALAAFAIAAIGLLGGVLWLGRSATQHRRGADSLRHDKLVLETQIAESTAALRDANERLRAIIDSTVDGVIVIDEGGRIEAFNRGAERLFGYPAPDVMGRNVSMLMPSPYHEEHDGYLQRYLTTGEARTIGIGRQVSGRRRDGTTFPLHLSVGEMSIDGVRKFTGMLHDLSQRSRLDHQLRDSEARWRAVVESAVDGIIVIDAHGRIESFNPAAERLFGYAERDVVGHNVKMLMPSPYYEEHDSYLARYAATGVRKIIGTGREVTGLRRDGTRFPLHLSVGEMNVGGAQKFTGIVHDLGARVRIEAQLREQTMLARLGEMAAVIAHEVKNPLAGIRGAIQVIGGRLSKDSKDALMVKEIVSRIDGLNNLMKDLLLFARPPRPQMQSVDPGHLIAMTVDLLSDDPAFKAVRVTVEGSAAPILADANLLKIVFVNLLANGAHAMAAGGTIHVSLAVVGDSCQIAVSDTGPGIAAEIRDKLFTPFVTTKARGTGLGLSTAKRLIEAHGGTIEITCPPDGGTTVTVRLPTQGVAAG